MEVGYFNGPFSEKGKKGYFYIKINLEVTFKTTLQNRKLQMPSSGRKPPLYPPLQVHHRWADLGHEAPGHRRDDGQERGARHQAGRGHHRWGLESRGGHFRYWARYFGSTESAIFYRIPQIFKKSKVAHGRSVKKL